MPIILLTARVQDADVQEGFDAGADDYLRKPFSPQELRVARAGDPRAGAEALLRARQLRSCWWSPSCSLCDLLVPVRTAVRSRAPSAGPPRAERRVRPSRSS